MGRSVLILAATLVVAAGAWAAESEADLPVILRVTAPERLPVGRAGEIRLTFRARQANVVAVVQVVEDLEGPSARRATRQREFNVIARAFGLDAGELTVPVSFASPGWKRISLTLVTDERDEGDPAVVEVEAIP